MEKLWSPWRSQYVESLHDKKGCEFCRIIEENDDDANFIVIRKEFNYIVMNIYPYNSGHLLVVPYEHIDDITVLRADVLNEATQLINLSIQTLRNIYSPAGFNIGLNLGAVAGAGIYEHVHYHVIPRWRGDTNFMPIIGQTKVISHDLKNGHEQIRKEMLSILEK